MSSVVTSAAGPLPPPGALPVADRAQPGADGLGLGRGGGGLLHLLPPGRPRYARPRGGRGHVLARSAAARTPPCHLSCHSLSVSGLHEAAYSLGNFTGPALAGLMYQKVSSGL